MRRIHHFPLHSNPSQYLDYPLREQLSSAAEKLGRTPRARRFISGAACVQGHSSYARSVPAGSFLNRCHNGKQQGQTLQMALALETMTPKFKGSL